MLNALELELELELVPKTDPKLERLLKSFSDDLLVELDKDNIKFASTFNKEQLRLYINNLIESYNEEK